MPGVAPSVLSAVVAAMLWAAEVSRGEGLCMVQREERGVWVPPPRSQP